MNTDICWDLNLTTHINFRSLEVVCRGSETQLQLTENLNLIALGDIKGNKIRLGSIFLVDICGSSITGFLTKLIQIMVC